MPGPSTSGNRRRVGMRNAVRTLAGPRSFLENARRRHEPVVVNALGVSEKQACDFTTPKRFCAGPGSGQQHQIQPIGAARTKQRTHHSRELASGQTAEPLRTQTRRTDESEARIPRRQKARASRPGWWPACSTISTRPSSGSSSSWTTRATTTAMIDYVGPSESYLEQILIRGVFVADGRRSDKR